MDVDRGRPARGRVLAAHDNRLLGEATDVVLRRHGYEVRRLPDGPLDGLVALAERWRPDVAVLGLELRRGRPDGLAVVGKLHRADVRVLVFTAPTAHSLRAACLAAGADGLLTAEEGLPAFVAMVDRAVAGEPLMDAQARLREERLARSCSGPEGGRWERFEQLTQREQEVLRALLRGASVPEMVDEFYVSVATVRSHVRSILGKLGVSSQLAAVVAAHAAGWPDARRSSSGDRRRLPSG